MCTHIHTECLKLSHPCAKPPGSNRKSTVWFWIKEPRSGEENRARPNSRQTGRGLKEDVRGYNSAANQAAPAEKLRGEVEP